MARGRRLWISAAYALFEVGVTAASFVVAVWIRRWINLDFLFPDFKESSVFPILPIVIVCWTPLLWWYGIFRVERTDRALFHIGRAFMAVSVGTLILLAFTYVLREFWISRAFLMIFVLLDLTALSVARLSAMGFWSYARARGYDRSYVLLVGTGKRARRHAEGLEEHRDWGIEVVGFVSERAIALDQVMGKPVAGSLGELEDILRGRVVDEVHFAVSRPTLERLDDALRTCHDMGIRARLVMDHLDGMKTEVYMQHLDGIPLMTFSPVPHREGALIAKRIMDLVFGVAVLVLAAPVMAVAAVLIVMTSKGPVLFKQKRVGVNGRTFNMYKFRTMVDGASELLDNLASRHGLDGATFKLKEDPRVTLVGRWLRKFSIDELPQLLNVIRGDMSIVGPRPCEPRDLSRYERWHRRRLSMRPGITCIWQVSGRNLIDFRQRVRMDIEYIENWSLLLDLKIILKTIPAVISSKGAY